MGQTEPGTAPDGSPDGRAPGEDFIDELVDRFSGDETDAPPSDVGILSGDEFPVFDYSRFDKAYTVFSKSCSYLAGAALLVVTLVAFVDVISSKFFGHSIPGQFDMVANLNLVMVFLGVFYVQMDRGSTSIELLQDHFNRWVKLAIRVIGSILGAGTCIFAAYRGWYNMADMYSVGQTATGVWKFPIWPFEAVLVFGFFFLGVAFFFTIGRDITDMRLRRGRYA